MVDIKFLNVIPNMLLKSGMEYLEWQSYNFFDELTNVIKETYNPQEKTLDLSRGYRSKIENCIKKYTNITVTIVLNDEDLLAIDTGFISPNSVMNISGLDGWLKTDYTKIHDAYKALNKNVIKGYCDLSTGKVEGDFKEITFKLAMMDSIAEVFNNKKYVENTGSTLPEMLAGGIIHECGHAFFGLHYLSSSVVDNAVVNQSIKMLINETDPVRKVAIARDAKKILDININEEVIKKEQKPEEILVIFEKGLFNRNYRRTLSLGVTEMSSEVLADLYAIRMGASHAVTSLVGSLNNKKTFWKKVKAIFIAYLIAQIGFFTIFSTIYILSQLVGSLLSFTMTLVPSIYDTPYRRMKAILRDNIAFLNSRAGDFTSEDTKRLIKDTKYIEELVDKQKSFFEATAVQRLLGWMMNGSDFRKTDFEHHTADLVSSKLALIDFANERK